MSNNYFTNQYHDYGLLPYPNASGPDQFLANIHFLQEKITATTRKLAYWDLYRISTILTDPNQFQGAVNDLLPYSSLIINTNISGEADYAPGDLVIKHDDGSIEKIKAERGGIFWPHKIIKDSNNYNYSFEFYYSAVPPSTSGGTPIVGVNNIWDASDAYAEKITYQGLFGGGVGSPYNNYQVDTINTTTSITAATRKNSSNVDVPIEPIVKLFSTKTINVGSVETTQYEEIYCDFDLKYDTSSKKYQISFTTGVPTIIKKMVVK